MARAYPSLCQPQNRECHPEQVAHGSGSRREGEGDSCSLSMSRFSYRFRLTRIVKLHVPMDKTQLRDCPDGRSELHQTNPFPSSPPEQCWLWGQEPHPASPCSSCPYRALILDVSRCFPSTNKAAVSVRTSEGALCTCNKKAVFFFFFFCCSSQGTRDLR